MSPHSPEENDEEKDEDHEQADIVPRGPMTNQGAQVDLRQAAFREALLRMSGPVIDQIRAQVPQYCGPLGGRRHRLMTMAADSAIRAYLDSPDRRSSARRKVHELFHRMGWGEAQEGNSSANLEAALGVATRASWEHLADVAVDHGLSAAVLRDVTNALRDYTMELRAELLRGHALGVRQPQHDPALARERLFDLFADSPAGRISPLAPLGVAPEALMLAAREADWRVPEEIVALVVSFHNDLDVPTRPDVLHRTDHRRTTMICPAPAAEELVSEIERSGTDRRVAVSLPVPAEEAGSAILWSTRALDLVELGAIAPTSVVRCADHVTALWLHSEPSLRRRLCQDLLRPLLGESSNSREILSETLLQWLETRDSAPAIAARLDVHPQTVRYRWRRINELFGDSLHDPEFVVQMMLVLKASVPLWKGGDQSDFELFRDNREASR